MALARAAALTVTVTLLLAGCSGGDDSSDAGPTPTPAPTTASRAPTEESPSASTGTPATRPPKPAPYPVSLPAFFERKPDGGDLRLGIVRERTAAYTSYDASYRSGHLRVTGVLNVPTSSGPFPAVVLAHGYIDPAIYVSGQGMTRERGFLSTNGFVAFHVDYRNHAGSGFDPLADRRLRTAYALDVINAVQALRRTSDVPVDDDRIALFGRSMGGGVVYKALEIAPGLVSAASVWAAVSSREDENFDHFIVGQSIRDDPGDRADLVRYVAQEYGLPGEKGSARFWRQISARTYFDRITEPVQVVHGTSDSTCPPPWARASYRALKAAGVDARLVWFRGEEHAFGPRFFDAMARTTRYFRAELNRSV